MAVVVPEKTTKTRTTGDLPVARAGFASADADLALGHDGRNVTNGRPRPLAFSEIKSRLLAHAGDAGLRVYAPRVLRDEETGDRTFAFGVVPRARGWKVPYRRHAEIKLYHDAAQEALVEGDARGDMFHDEDADLEIEVAYVLLGPACGVAVEDVGRVVEPLASKVNEVLGGRRQVYYTISTGHPITGASHVVEAKVDDLHVTSLVASEFDAGFLKGVAAALRAVGPG